MPLSRIVLRGMPPVSLTTTDPRLAAIVPSPSDWPRLALGFPVPEWYVALSASTTPWPMALGSLEARSARAVEVSAHLT